MVFSGVFKTPSGVHTEELFASTTLLNDLHKPRFQLLNGRHVVGKDTHISRLSRYVDLDAGSWSRGQLIDLILPSEWPLRAAWAVGWRTHLWKYILTRGEVQGQHRKDRTGSPGAEE